jgi:hypothetical protein
VKGVPLAQFPTQWLAVMWSGIRSSITGFETIILDCQVIASTPKLGTDPDQIVFRV